MAFGDLRLFYSSHILFLRGLVTIPPQVSCGKTLQVFTHIYIYINWFRSWHIYIYKLAWVLALTLSFALTPLTPSPIIS
jgi:hypothetical protein